MRNADVYVELPQGSKQDEPLILPAVYTGRKSGAWLYVVMAVGSQHSPYRHVFKQWVHLDQILMADEVEEC